MKIMSSTVYSQNAKTPCNTSSPLSFCGKRTAELQVFCHHIYEFKKGLRNLVLATESAASRQSIEERLKKEQISYVIHEISEEKINVYFGNKACIDVIHTFSPKLNELSPEQDFILGIMLGYDRLQQCDRYLKMRKKGLKLENLIG